MHISPNELREKPCSAHSGLLFESLPKLLPSLLDIECPAQKTAWELFFSFCRPNCLLIILCNIHCRVEYYLLLLLLTSTPDAYSYDTTIPIRAYVYSTRPHLYLLTQKHQWPFLACDPVKLNISLETPPQRLHENMLHKVQVKVDFHFNDCYMRICFREAHSKYYIS